MSIVDIDAPADGAYLPKRVAPLPIIGIQCCRREIATQYSTHPVHAVVKKYVDAVVDGTGGMPLLVPAEEADAATAAAIAARLDGLLVPGSPSNVEPYHYDGPPSQPKTLHDPARDAMALPLLRAAAPVGASGMLIIASGRIDQVIVFEMLGSRSAGYYGSAYNLLNQAHFVPMSILATLAPVIAAAWPADRDRMLRVVRLAAEMMAYDPTAGELRTHYAGFFDPGFGYDPNGRKLGSRAALEVRARDVPFMVEHRQPICKLAFEAMLEPPEKLYGAEAGSNYQGQQTTLSKHFAEHATGAPRGTASAAWAGAERQGTAPLFEH